MNYKTLKNIYPYDTAIGRIYVVDNGSAIAGVFLPGNAVPGYTAERNGCDKARGCPDNGVSVGKAARIRCKGGAGGYGFSEKGMGGTPHHSLWSYVQLFAYCAYCGQSESMPCRWDGQQQKSGFDNNTVPQGDRQVRSTGGLRRRAGTEEILSGHGSCKYYSGLKFL